MTTKTVALIVFGSFVIAASFLPTKVMVGAIIAAYITFNNVVSA